MFEYATTCGKGAAWFEGEISGTPEDPSEPPGDGWEFVAMAADRQIIYWTWRRETRR